MKKSPTTFELVSKVIAILGALAGAGFAVTYRFDLATLSFAVATFNMANSCYERLHPRCSCGSDDYAEAFGKDFCKFWLMATDAHKVCKDYQVDTIDAPEEGT